MKVLFITFIPSPYRLSFFEELAKECELTVLFERSSSKIRKNHWDNFQFNGYKGVVLKGVTVGGYDKLCPGIIQYLNNDYDIIVISDPTSPTGILASFILKMKKIQYYVESDGALPSGKTSGIKYIIKRFVMASAYKCFSTASLHDQYYIECGVLPQKIVRYPFTSLYDKAISHEVKSQEINEKLRRKLGISENKMILSVGQLVYRKGYDVLLKGWDKVPDYIGLYIVGGKPSDELLKMAKNKKNIHFVDFMPSEQLEEYYLCADVFVLPTREDVWGLVINEAMAKGLPVITTNKCVAGLELISNGENGYIVEAENSEELVSRINEIITDEKTLQSMSACSLRTIRDYTFEKMAQVHIDEFKKDLKEDL